MKHVRFLAVAVLFVGINHAFAQAPTQDRSFLKICELYGAADSGAQAWNKNEKCDLPKGFHLDTSYHQQIFACCGGGATSDFSVSDIPAGIHLQVDGGHYWSVDEPMGLMTMEEDSEGRAVLRRFFIHTYCGQKGSRGPVVM
jgi:hypothetical protein